MKEMTSVATTMMSDEERAELEKGLNNPNANGNGVNASVSGTATSTSNVTLETPITPIAPQPEHPTPSSADPSVSNAHRQSLIHTPSPAPGTSDSKSEVNASGAETPKNKKRSKISPEQKQKLQQIEDERRKNMEERIDTLTKKLVDRLRPFVEAKHTGAKDDPETKSFEEKIKREADDLKLESFGVEVRHVSMILQSSS